MNPARELQRVWLSIAKLPPHLTNRPFDLVLRKLHPDDLNEIHNYYGGRMQQIRAEKGRRQGCDRCTTMAGCKVSEDGECLVS